MPRYKLKSGQEAFQIVDGPDAGNSFERNVEYPKLPAGYENRFEPVRKAPNPEPARPAADKSTKAKEKKS